MNLTNFIYILDTITDPSSLCSEQALKNVLYLVGIVFMALKIGAPIILIAVGMIELIKAITEQNEDALKKATQKLVKKAVAALAIFLIGSLVGLILGLVGGTEYEECMTCINKPGQCTPVWN